MSYQLAQKVLTMPPWCVPSRYQSAMPSQMQIAGLEGEALRVRAVGEDDRMLAAARGTINIRAQHGAIVHLDRNVPIDLQSPSSSSRTFYSIRQPAANNGRNSVFAAVVEVVR